MPLLAQEFASVKGSEFLVPIALTIPALCLALFSPLAGWLADRFGRKRPLVVALFFYAFAGMAPYFLENLYQIIAARVVLGIFEAVIMVIATTLIGDYFLGKARQRWLAIQIVVISISAIILVAVGGWMGSELGSRGPFLLYVMGIPLAIICQLGLFEPLERNSEENSSEPVPIKQIMPLTILAIILGILFYVTIVKLGPILALKTEVTPGLIGLVGAINNAGVTLGAAIFGFGRVWLSAGKLSALAMFLIAIGYFGTVEFESLNMTIVATTAVCMGAGIGMPTYLSWVVSKLALTVRGRGIGIAQGGFFLGQFFAPLIAVSLSKQIGGFSEALVIFAILASIMMAILLIIGRSQPPLAQAIAK